MFSYDVTTAIGKVRLLISDTEDDGHIFENEEIQAFLDMEAGAIYLAAAISVEAIAGNEVLVQKRIKTLDLETDGPAEAKQLLALAASWRKQQVRIDEEDADTGFEIAEMVIDPFQEREVVFGDALWNA